MRRHTDGVARRRSLRLRIGFASVGVVAVLGPACSSSQGAAPSPSLSPTSASSPYFDSAPRELVANFAAGIGGTMACSSGDLVFADGPQRTLYTTRLTVFQPRKLLTVTGIVGPISMSGSWAAFAVYKQAADQISPLAAWSVYGFQITTGRAVVLASGTGATELSELPYPTAGGGFIVWDQVTNGGKKVLKRFDVNSGMTTELTLPTGTYPVYPSAAGGALLFLDNSRDPGHASETWLARGGEPLLLDMSTGALSHLATGSVVAKAVLTPSRAVWISLSTGAALYDIQEAAIPGGAARTLAQTTTVARLWANSQITIWLDGIRGAVTALLGRRTAVVSPDLTISPGGIALCGSDLYYAGPNLSLRVATIG